MAGQAASQASATARRPAARPADSAAPPPLVCTSHDAARRPPLGGGGLCRPAAVDDDARGRRPASWRPGRRAPARRPRRRRRRPRCAAGAPPQRAGVGRRCHTGRRPRRLWRQRPGRRAGGGRAGRRPREARPRGARDLAAPRGGVSAGISFIGSVVDFGRTFVFVQYSNWDGMQGGHTISATGYRQGRGRFGIWPCHGDVTPPQCRLFIGLETGVTRRSAGPEFDWSRAVGARAYV